MKKRILIIIPVLLLAIVAATPSSKYFDIARNLDIFATLFKEVNTYYVDEIDPSDLVKTGIDAMLLSLDPYTSYIPEEEIENYRTMTTGQYAGIGALIGKLNGKNLIMMPYEGFAAEKNGLRIADEIIEVDGVDVREMEINDITKLLKGQIRTDVTLKINRLNVVEPIELTITREKIRVGNVPYFGKVNEDIGYIKLEDFTMGAGREVKEALIELKKHDIKGIILDLRGNPGGLLSEAVNVSNVFIPKGKDVVSTKGKIQEWNKTYKALSNPVDTHIPLAVLIDNGSASASEIVSGVIQDYDRGVLVGRKTFGKGLVQTTRPLTYNSQLKVTTAKYYIPSGRCIQAVDYTHRNENGIAEKIPDSLKLEFKTKGGREVYDGSGLSPDFQIESEYFAPVTQKLIISGLIFDYATKFYYENKEIENALDFSISDKQYAEFTKWLSGKDYDYVTQVELTFEDLVMTAKEDKYYEDIKKPLESLKERIKHNKDNDLKIFKEEISEILEEEIISRYYLYKGEIQATFDDDKDLQSAIDILSDKNKYQKLLQ